MEENINMECCKINATSYKLKKQDFYIFMLGNAAKFLLDVLPVLPTSERYSL